MNTLNYLKQNFKGLKGKRVAVTGATGGLGYELCLMLAELGASLILLNRSEEKARGLKQYILEQLPDTDITLLQLDLEDIGSVKAACNELDRLEINILIHNAGAYSIPRKKCSTGFDNVFQINCLAPYYMTRKLMSTLKKHKDGRVICVGSIAHNYSKTDSDDPQFLKRNKSSLVYGNAKRHLMLSLYKLFESQDTVSLAVTHPGITFTNITAHYPKLIFAIIKHPMKIIFMKPKKAALSIMCGVFEKCKYREWIGPSLFNVWGKPKKRLLKTFLDSEAETVFEICEKMYASIE